MDSLPEFFIPSPEENRLENLLRHPARITLRRAGGETSDLEAQPGLVNISEEHPQVDRMGGDWGAICEVFRQSSYYYLNVQGVTLAVWDEIRVFGTENTMVELKVTEIENGRARIDAPVIRVVR